MSILKNIEQKRFSPLYLLYGNENFIINEAKQKLMANVLTEEEMEFNYTSYDLEEIPIDVAIDDAETIPFVGERKLILLHHPIFLTSSKPKEKVDHNLKKLAQYIENPAPYSVLVFLGSYEKLDERKKITKLLKKHATVLEARRLKDHELKKWIQDRLHVYDVEMDEEAIEQLIYLIGNNLMNLHAEMEKLSLYVKDTKRITKEEVDSLTARSLEQNVFTLVEKVVQRQIDEALRIYYDLLKQNEEPIKILALLSGQFRLIYQVKELIGRGYGQRQIASMLKVHPYRVKLAARYANSFTEKELSQLMHLLATGDYEMKTGGLGKTMIIELLLMKLHKGND